MLGKHTTTAGARCAQWKIPGIELISSVAVDISDESWEWVDRSVFFPPVSNNIHMNSILSSLRR